MMPIAFLLGIRFGAIGLAWAWLGAFPLLTAVTARLAGGAMGLRLMDLIRAAAPGLGCSIMMAGIVLIVDSLLPPLPALVRLCVLVPSGAFAFLAALMLCARGTLMELVSLVVRRTALQPAPA